jgi:hypothetical protein
MLGASPRRSAVTFVKKVNSATKAWRKQGGGSSFKHFLLESSYHIQGKKICSYFDQIHFTFLEVPGSREL